MTAGNVGFSQGIDRDDREVGNAITVLSVFGSKA
jgi:hypothetical protein